MADGGLRTRVEEIGRQVAEARRCVDRGDATSAGWRARWAAEAMLLVLCELHGVEVPATSPGENTIGTLRRALRHARKLERKLEDHLAHVQNVGNRAAHAQHEPELAVDLGEARALLPVLEHLWTAFLEQLPAELRPAAAPPPEVPVVPEAPAPSGTGRLGRVAWGVLAVVAVVATPVAAFALVIAVLGGTPPEPDTPPAFVPPRVEDLLPEAAVERPVVAPPTPAELVQSERLVAPADLAGLDCDALAVVRNWVWARHGLRFRTEPARAAFADASGYHPYTDDEAAVEARFTDVDRRNLGRLEEALDAARCACPRRELEPCPR